MASDDAFEFLQEKLLAGRTLRQFYTDVNGQPPQGWRDTVNLRARGTTYSRNLPYFVYQGKMMEVILPQYMAKYLPYNPQHLPVVVKLVDPFMEEYVIQLIQQMGRACLEETRDQMFLRRSIQDAERIKPSHQDEEIYKE